MAVIYSCGNSGENSNEQNADSSATEAAEQAQPEETASKQTEPELYKYFSKEEISAKMQHALSVLEKAEKNDNDPFKSNILALYKDFIGEEGWNVSPDALEEKWGKPTTKTEDSYVYPASESTVHSYEYTYPHFHVTINDMNEWQAEKISTNTAGFGFAGVYVGIAECNKTFIEKLFAQAPAIEKNSDEWIITIYEPTGTKINISFNQDETVKEVSYNFGHYIE